MPQTQKRQTNRDKLQEALAPYRGKVLQSFEMRRIVLARISEFKPGSFLPNDHSDIGSKSSCSCVGTDRRLLDRVARQTYMVR
jgi:hypothetical protein